MKFTFLSLFNGLCCNFVCMHREGSAHGFGIRVTQSAEGSDSWVDDPITRHIMSLFINKDEEGQNNMLWPLILHMKGHYCILVLPLVEPQHMKTYAGICRKSDCGNAIGVPGGLSSLLFDLPSITGYGKLLAMLFSKHAVIKQFIPVKVIFQGCSTTRLD